MLIAVRTRPLSKSEFEDSNFNTISVPEKDVIKLSMPTEYIPDDMSGIFLAGEQIKILKVKEISYEYDFVFGENATQEEVYENTTASLIKQVVEGYSATIMAYGATGSGKTYTMVGKGDKVGLMIRSIRDLFNFVNSQQNKVCNIKISYIEVYNEVLKDLLSDKKIAPEIRTDPNRGVIIQGAQCIKVNSEKEAFKLINLGNKRRTEKQTDRNQFSSRSHAILQIYLEIQEQKSENNCEINNLNDKLRNHACNIEQLQNKLDSSTALNCNLQNTIKDYERQIVNFRNDNDNLKKNLIKERNIRNDEEKRNEELSQMINERERRIQILNDEYEQGKKIRQQICCDNDGFQMENDKLKDHINVLTCQNQKLIGELENVLAQDEKMNGPLSRRDKISILLRNNKMTLEQSAHTLNEFAEGGNSNVVNSGTKVYE